MNENQKQLDELSAAVRENGRLEMAIAVLEWAKRNRDAISAKEMGELVKICQPGSPQAPLSLTAVSNAETASPATHKGD